MKNTNIDSIDCPLLMYWLLVVRVPSQIFVSPLSFEKSLIDYIFQ